MSSVDDALAQVYEKLVIKPDWIALVDDNGMYVGSYNCNLSDDAIAGMLISMHNCNRSVLSYTGGHLKRELSFAVASNDAGHVIVFVIGKARYILGLRFSGDANFSSLSILQKSLLTAIAPLVDAIDLDS